MAPNDILKRLKEGNIRFIKTKLLKRDTCSSRREELASEQSPYAVILGCADSRVVPELVFDVGLGELFVVRVAGNIANKSSLASMEYAVENLGSRLIVVLGHQSCGAVIAAVNGGNLGPNLNHLVGHIKPALELSSKETSLEEVIRKNAQLTAKAICSSSEIIAKAVNKGRVEIVPAYYHLDSGEVEFL